MIEEIEAKIQETVDTATDEQQVILKAHASQAVKSSSKSKRKRFDSLMTCCVGHVRDFHLLLPTAKRKQQAKSLSESNEVSPDEDDLDIPGHPAHLDKASPHNRSPRRRPGRQRERSTRKKIAVAQSSSDESSAQEEEEKEAEPVVKLQKETRSSRALQRRADANTDSEQDDFIKPPPRGNGNFVCKCVIESIIKTLLLLYRKI